MLAEATQIIADFPALRSTLSPQCFGLEIGDSQRMAMRSFRLQRTLDAAWWHWEGLAGSVAGESGGAGGLGDAYAPDAPKSFQPRSSPQPCLQDDHQSLPFPHRCGLKNFMPAFSMTGRGLGLVQRVTTLPPTRFAARSRSRR